MKTFFSIKDGVSSFDWTDFPSNLRHAADRLVAAMVTSSYLDVLSVLIQENKVLLFEALKSAGASQARVDYSGDGDSGGVTDITICDERGEMSVERDLHLFCATFSWGGVKSLCLNDVSLNEALSAFTEDLIDHFGHSGYENNSGGFGCALFNVSSGSVVLEHSDYIMMTEDHSHEL